MIYKVLVALAAVVILVGSVLLGGREHAANPSTADSRDLPHDREGYAARRARLVQTGPDGKALYTVEAETLQQKPDEGTVELDQVRVSFRDDADNVWKAWGDHASLGQATGQVELVGNVQVAGLLPGTQDEAHLATQRLHVDTQAQMVRTRDRVTMSTSDKHNRLQAKGLTANLRNGHVRLESAVHGTYVP